MFLSPPVRKPHVRPRELPAVHGNPVLRHVRQSDFPHLFRYEFGRGELCVRTGRAVSQLRIARIFFHLLRKSIRISAVHSCRKFFVNLPIQSSASFFHALCFSAEIPRRNASRLYYTTKIPPKQSSDGLFHKIFFNFPALAFALRSFLRATAFAPRAASRIPCLSSPLNGHIPARPAPIFFCPSS